MRSLSFFLLSVWIVCLIGLADSFAQSKVLASVNDEEITVTSFNRKYKKILEEAINPPSKSQFLEDLVRFEVGVLEAERLRGRYNPEVRLEIRKILYRWLLEIDLGIDVQGIQVSQQEMRRHYRSHPEIRLSHILLEMRPGLTRKQKIAYRKRARQIYTTVRKSKRSFSDLAKVYTDDVATKDMGGDLGWQSRNTIIPQYYSAVIKQRVGQIAPLIETKYGFHIVKLTGKNSYDKANKENLRLAVFEQKKKRMFDLYFLRLKRRYKVAKNASLVNRLMRGPINAKARSRSIASVNGKNITFDSFHKNYKQTVDTTINPPSQNRFLEDLIQFEMGVQEAQRKRIAMDSRVQEEIRKLLYRWVIEKDLGQKVESIKVSQQEMQRYYRRNPEIRTSHILIELPPNATKKQRGTIKKRATQIYANVRRSKRPFADLVKLYTDDTFTRDTGGDLGWQSRNLMIPAYYNAVRKLRKGQITRLIETQYGFHIIQLNGRNTYKQASKEHIRLAIFEQKRRKIFDDYFARLKKRYKIRKNIILLSSSR